MPSRLPQALLRSHNAYPYLPYRLSSSPLPSPLPNSCLFFSSLSNFRLNDVSTIDQRPLRACVVGASVGGLVAARLLQRLGFEVCVVDRLPSLQLKLKLDKPLCLYPKALEVLSQLALPICKYLIYTPPLAYMDARGHWTCKLVSSKSISGNSVENQRNNNSNTNNSINNNNSGVMSTAGFDSDLRIALTRRSDLLRLLVEEPSKELPILFGREVMNIEGNNNNGVFGSKPLRLDLRVVDNESSSEISGDPSMSVLARASPGPYNSGPTGPASEVLYADLVIGADGPQSQCRRICSPATRRGYFQYTGQRSLTGLLRLTREQWMGLSGTFRDAIANEPQPIELVDEIGNRFTVFPLPAPLEVPLEGESRGYYLGWTASFSDKLTDPYGSSLEEWGVVRGADILERLTGMYSNSDVRHLLDLHFKTYENPIHSEYHFEDLQREWYKGRVAYIGGACASFSPILLQGTSIAIEDAWELSIALSRLTCPFSLAQTAAYYSNPKTPQPITYTVSKSLWLGQKPLPKAVLSVCSCYFNYSKNRAHRLSEYARITKFATWFNSESGGLMRDRITRYLPVKVCDFVYSGYLIDCMGGKAFQLSDRPKHFYVPGQESELKPGLAGLEGQHIEESELDRIDNENIARNKAYDYYRVDVGAKWLKRLFSFKWFESKR